jgi:hypothetical protein
MGIIIVSTVVAAVCTSFASSLKDISFGKLVDVYYLTGAIAGLTTQLCWVFEASSSKTQLQAKRREVRDES